MAEKPDYVDAIRYMMQHGGTVVLHGDTHQYKGGDLHRLRVLGREPRARPSHGLARVRRAKLRDAIGECIKNGVYPLLWETPHYSASTLDYSSSPSTSRPPWSSGWCWTTSTTASSFRTSSTTTCTASASTGESRLHPIDPDPAKEQAAVDRLLAFARSTRGARRDRFGVLPPVRPVGVPHEVGRRIQAQGYSFLDVREASNTVTLDDRAIVSGRPA